MDPRERTRETERRHATVLFADITGFTSMSEQMDSYEVHSVITGCLELMDEIARKHGGNVDKYLGDCVMAVFGVPVAIEDAAKAAVNAAIEMRRRVHEYNRERRLTVPLDIHSGINSGLMISGDISGPAMREFAVMGEAVNVASHLKDIAPKGSIYVGSETHQDTRGQFDYRSLESTRIKGKQDPVPVFELLSEEQQIYRRRVDSGRLIFSDLVGRDEEFARVRHAVTRLLDGEGAFLGLTGEPGIGKSRLVAELARCREVERTTFLIGRSLSIGQTLSYHPFTDLLRTWAGISRQDPEPVALDKLERALTRLLGSDAEEELPFVTTLMGLSPRGEALSRVRGIQGEAMSKFILKSMKQLLGRLAQRRPLVLVFEDLHWADLSSIELLESLIGLLKTHPILVLAVCRPGFAETTERVLETARAELDGRHQHVMLSPLSPVDSHKLIDNLLRDAEIPGTLRAQINDRAAGNPFYIEEIIRSLIDEGALEERDGGLRATERIQTATIPGTIREVIMARVDRLDLRRKAVLQIGSVIGRSFEEVLLEELAEHPENLDADLDSLADLQFINHVGEWHFKHALIQDVVYEMITRAKRKELHRRVAEAAEQRLQQRPNISARLAYHFGRGGDLDRAEHYLFLAGDEAAKSAASNEALQLFQEAARLYFEIHGDGGDPEKKALLQKNIALAFFNRGLFIEAADSFTRALELLGEPVPKTVPALAIRGARTVAEILFDIYRPNPTRPRPASTPKQREVVEIMFNRARAQTTAAPAKFLLDSLEALRRIRRVDPKTVPQAGGMYAGAAGPFSYTGISFGIIERLLARVEALVNPEDPREVFLYRLMSFLHHTLKGDWGESHAADEELIQEALRLGQLWDVTTYLGLDLQKKLHQGRWSEAQARLDQLWKLEDLYAYELAQSNRLGISSFYFLERGELEEAARWADEYYATFRENLMNTIGLGIQAKIALFRGDLATAEERVHRATALVASSGLVPPFHLAHFRRSELLFAVKRLEEACQHGDRAAIREWSRRARAAERKAVRVVPKIAWHRVEVYRLAGTSQWLRGRRRKAFEWWEKSMEEGVRLGMRPELARTYFEVGLRLRRADRAPKTFLGKGAEEYLESGAALFEELGLKCNDETLQLTQSAAA